MAKDYKELLARINRDLEKSHEKIKNNPPPKLTQEYLEIHSQKFKESLEKTKKAHVLIDQIKEFDEKQDYESIDNLIENSKIYDDEYTISYR